MSHFGRFPGGPPVRGFDGKASVMTQNRQVKEAATIRLHSKVLSVLFYFIVLLLITIQDFLGLV